MADPLDPLAPYPTVEDVTAYLASVRPGSPWEALSTEQQAAGVTQATIQFESLCWQGERCEVDQPYAWPRTGASCCDQELSCEVLPKGVEVAFCELASALATNPTLLFGAPPSTVPTGLYVSDQRLGELGQSFAAFPAGSGGTKYGVRAPMLFQRFPWAGELLECWVVGSWGAARVLSRC
jgi:hypothetical protein